MVAWVFGLQLYVLTEGVVFLNFKGEIASLMLLLVFVLRLVSNFTFPKRLKGLQRPRVAIIELISKSYPHLGVCQIVDGLNFAEIAVFTVLFLLIERLPQLLHFQPLEDFPPDSG